MGKNKSHSKPLTHEEIWDDSALVRSWDEAVEEYKLYHSIHARGENVEDVLREAEAAQEAGEDFQGDSIDDDHPMGMDEANVDVDSAEPAAPLDESKTILREGLPKTVNDVQPQQSGGISTTGAPTGPTVPHAAMGQVQDEGLKNLMMAWYFAGYYTGLYEGQQKAKQNPGS
ncbi:hypothetical protein ASPZODRAFT_144729 [Penicilliopsis zonata CBS 506.65]|uniref:Survival Motor Neuron Gemin2-binding domain-containing protein n=1 Tax=Penicilliopsis zonata CBS 506.65 TaxID=1073090 RepID=A0A1L9SC82_9EURO|nr:hypothetical protein ASPZODRAFT_144729 [Penicilliopsis zonata CBS 506.65]OJJ44781.1 hypothetical protein ASPZODRAFT_144729 [Penicilliopsis zonata CBS 506.65]